VFGGLLNVFAEVYGCRNMLINVINRIYGIMVFSLASRRDQVCPSRNPQPSNYKCSRDEKPNSTKPYSEKLVHEGPQIVYDIHRPIERLRTSRSVVPASNILPVSVLHAETMAGANRLGSIL
jgi:hypothetical protein